MRSKKFFPLFILFVLAAGLLLFLFIPPRLPEWERRLFEHFANQATLEFFDGSLRLGKAEVNRQMKLTVENIRGRLKTREGSVPIQVNRLVSEDPVTDFLFNRTVRFRFSGIKTESSLYEGAEGILVVRGGSDGFVDFRAEIKSLGLEDLSWLNPEQLQGSTGRMSGYMTFRSDARQDPVLGMEFLVQEPGGNIQAQFFDVLLPYLPQMKNVEKLRTVAGTKSLVRYRDAALIVKIDDPDKMKVFLHILIPDYNLNLNLNLEIRTDKKNAFMEIAQLLGLFEVAVK